MRLTIERRQRIEAFVAVHPNGVSANQIVEFCLRNHPARVLTEVRAFLDERVGRGELVAWWPSPSRQTAWKSIKLYARTLPAGLATAFRGDGTFVEVGRVRE